MPVQDRGPCRTEKRKRPGLNLGALPKSNSGLCACCILALPRYAASVLIFCCTQQLVCGLLASLPCSCSLKTSCGEKIPHEGGRAVFSQPLKTFSTWGRLARNRSRAPIPRPCAQSWPRFGCQRRLFSLRFCHKSLAVLRLWQLWQRLRRLVLSMNFSQSPL